MDRRSSEQRFHDRRGRTKGWASKFGGAAFSLLKGSAMTPSLGWTSWIETMRRFRIVIIRSRRLESRKYNCGGGFFPAVRTIESQSFDQGIRSRIQLLESLECLDHCFSSFSSSNSLLSFRRLCSRRTGTILKLVDSRGKCNSRIHLFSEIRVDESSRKLWKTSCARSCHGSLGHRALHSA